jgi:3-isopropylmalate/(R)-2-methylmalate dehydratase large subunit
MTGMGQTRFQKVEARHLVELGGQSKALAVGLHIIHEVTSSQAFAALKKMGIPVHRAANTFAVTDHVVNTGGSSAPNDLMDEILIKTLEDNCREHGITLYGQHNGLQGVCHVVAPEAGLTRPNTTIFCGDSHTSTHGAFGAIAAGIGTSNVRDILATGCLLNYTSPRQIKVEVNGKLASHLSAKDIILYILSKVGNEWATGGAVFFTGSTIADLSITGRMTICNMTIEMGGRFGYCDVDDNTIAWFKNDRDFFKTGDLTPELIADWKSLNTDADAVFDDTLVIDAADIRQMVSYGLTLNEIVPVDGKIGEIKGIHPSRAHLEMAVGASASQIEFQHAFIGSCTNGRVEDFEAAAKVLRLHGGKVKVKSALAVPGSIEVKRTCEANGIAQVFKDAGFEWRDPGCSSCLAMNPDKFDGRVASSTNRNFPGRQGPLSRTYLMSPESVALAALEGKMSDIQAFYSAKGAK